MLPFHFVLPSLQSAKVGAEVGLGGGRITAVPQCFPLRGARRRVPGLLSPPCTGAFRSLSPAVSERSCVPARCGSRLRALRVLRPCPAECGVRVGSGLRANYPPPSPAEWGGEVGVGYNLLWRCGMLNFPLLDTRPWGPGEVTSPQSCPLASAQRYPRRLAAGRRATSPQLPSAGFPIHRR